jgi:hypothetical protein
MSLPNRSSIVELDSSDTSEQGMAARLPLPGNSDGLTTKASLLL